MASLLRVWLSEGPFHYLHMYIGDSTKNMLVEINSRPLNLLGLNLIFCSCNRVLQTFSLPWCSSHIFLSIMFVISSSTFFYFLFPMVFFFLFLSNSYRFAFSLIYIIPCLINAVYAEYTDLHINIPLSVLCQCV